MHLVGYILEYSNLATWLKLQVFTLRNTGLMCFKMQGELEVPFIKWILLLTIRQLKHTGASLCLIHSWPNKRYFLIVDKRPIVQGIGVLVNKGREGRAKT